MASKTNLTVVVDIGTSKLVALAGKKTEQGKIEIIAVAQVPSKGIKRGMVFNIEECAKSVDLVLRKLESQLDEEVDGVSIAYAGYNMRTVNFQGYRFTSEEGVVSRFDINELFNEAKNFKVDQNFKTLHVIPQKFVIDDEITETNPIGISGRKIEANYKLITVPVSQLTNLQRVFDKIQVELKGVTLSPLAISEVVLSEDEKELGAVVLDIGEGTTKLSVYTENILSHMAIIPFGGGVVTKDIKEGCSILLKWAEQLKVKYGEALGDQADEQKVVTIPGNNGWEPKEISFRSLAFIIQARMEEIIDAVSFQIEKAIQSENLGAGIIITGGTSKLYNIIPLIKFRTGMDARIAHPVFLPVNEKKQFQNPDYFTALGLLKLKLKHSNGFEKPGRKRETKKKEGNGFPFLGKLFQGMLDFVDLVDDENDDVEMN